MFLRRVERVARRAEEVVVAGAAKAHDRAVGLADEDGAGLLDPLGERAVELGTMKSFSARTPPKVAGQPGLKSNRSLIAVGHAVQRPERRARHQRVLGLPRPRPAPRRSRDRRSALRLGLRASIAGDDGVDDLDRRAARGGGCGAPDRPPAAVGELVRTVPSATSLILDAARLSAPMQLEIVPREEAGSPARNSAALLPAPPASRTGRATPCCCSPSGYVRTCDRSTRGNDAAIRTVRDAGWGSESNVGSESETSRRVLSSSI